MKWPPSARIKPLHKLTMNSEYLPSKMLVVQGVIIIRDDQSITSRIQEMAPKMMWDVESHLLESKEKKMEIVLICRKKFWAIV